MTQLLDLGGVHKVVDSIEFVVGPGTTGKDHYRFSFPQKWIWIQCSDESILLRVRDQQQDLDRPLHTEETGVTMLPPRDG